MRNEQIGLALLLYFIFSSLGYSQITFQKPFGPEGKNISCLAADSVGNIYCGGVSGVFKSTDEGATWVNI